MLQGAVAALLIAVAAPAAAAPANDPAPAGSDFSVIEASLSRMQALGEAGKFRQALNELDRLDSKTRTPAAHLVYAMMRSHLLLADGREPEAIATLDKLLELRPGDGRFVAVTAAGYVEAGLWPLAEHALGRAISMAPDDTRALPFETINKLIGGLRAMKRKDAADRLMVRLGQIGYGGDDFQTRDWLAWEAAQDAVRRGDLDAAKSLVVNIDSVDVLDTLLTDRRYTALWPAVEARIGPKMEQPRTAALIAAERWLKGKPDDLTAKRTWFAALVNDGRFAEGDSFAKGFATTPDEIRQLTEAGGWFVNDHARLLLRMGRLADADARIASLRAIDIAKAPWLISMVINRATGQAYRGQSEKAKALFVEAASLAERYGSPYARQLIDSGRICVSGGDAAVADKLLPVVLARADEGPIQAIESLLCAGKQDEAAKRVIALLADEDRRSHAIGELVQPLITPGSDHAYPGTVARLLERADVRAAFDKVARPVPAEFRRD